MIFFYLCGNYLLRDLWRNKESHKAGSKTHQIMHPKVCECLLLSNYFWIINDFLFSCLRFFIFSSSRDEHVTDQGKYTNISSPQRREAERDGD